MQVLYRSFIVLICSTFFSAQISLGVAAEVPSALPAPVMASASAGQTPSALPTIELSFDYIDANLPTVLKSIAYSCDLNLVVDKDIKGKVTGQMRNVSLDDALKAILRVNGYGFSRKEGIIYIVPQAEIELVTEVLPLGYLLAKDAKGLLVKFLSKRGEIQVQEATNSLIVTDTLDDLKNFKEKMRDIDQPPLQVLIEAKIVDINTNDAQTIGTAINATYTPGSGDLASATIETGELVARGVGGSLNLVPNFKYLTSADMTIGALVEKSRARILAAPSIATLNGLEAKILIGERIPYNDSTSSITPGSGNTTTTSSVKYVDVGTSLKVTPLVSPDGWVTMKIRPEVSKVNDYSADGVPLVGTREAEATIRVRNNETIIIGGLINNEDFSSQDGVPGLKDIPVLGWFFKKHVSTKAQSEMMVFITPRIITSPRAAGAEGAAEEKTAVQPSGEKAALADLPNEVYIDAQTLSEDTGRLIGLLAYANDIEGSQGKKGSDNLYIKLELLKTYKMILEDFPNSGKGDYCLYKIASLYINDFGKCGAAQEALTQLEDRFPDSPYIDATQAMVRSCPKEAFIIREVSGSAKSVRK